MAKGTRLGEASCYFHLRSRGQKQSLTTHQHLIDVHDILDIKRGGQKKGMQKGHNTELHAFIS
jgi:hypothetical protein